MMCPKCGDEMKEEHDRAYNGHTVEFWYFWHCNSCGYVHNESGGYEDDDY